MSSRRLALDELPAWPRGMTREVAAAYLGMSPEKFDQGVRSGDWPRATFTKGVKGARQWLWDKALLDARFDELSGGPQARQPENPLIRRLRDRGQNHGENPVPR